MALTVLGGRIELIGRAGDKRLPGYADFATLGEGGVPFIANTWARVLAPTKTPREIIVRLNTEINRILATPEVRQRLESTGIVPGSGNPDEVLAFLKSEIERNAKVVKAAGIKLEQ